jgi:hypothetical protein
MMKTTLAVAAAAILVAATPFFVSSPAGAENIKLAQVTVGPVEVGPKGVTVGPKEKTAKCRTVTTTTETSDGRKVTKKERVCD